MAWNARPPFAVALLVATSLAPSFAQAAIDAAEAMTVRGHVICLDSALADGGGEDACNERGARFALQTTDGAIFSLLPEDPKQEMFIDPRIRARELQIHGRRRGHGRLEIINVYTIIDGELHVPHDRCDVCNITANAPGPCWCCGAEFELREPPLKETTIP
jgi:hypothetical protein